MKLSQKKQDKLLSGITLLVALLAWEVLSRTNVIDKDFFPAPTIIMGAFWELSTNGEMFGRVGDALQQLFAGNIAGFLKAIGEGHLWISLMRIFAGFLMGATPGLIIGVLMGMNRKIRVMLDPMMSAMFVVPKVTLLPFIMLLFGIGEISKIITVAIAAFFVVLFNSMAGVLQIESIYLDAAKSYGANRLQMFWEVIIPGAMPIIFVGLRLGLGTSLIVIVSAEFVAARSGLGYLVWNSWQLLFVAKMFVGILSIMGLGVLFTAGQARVERWFMPWQRSEPTGGVIEGEVV